MSDTKHAPTPYRVDHADDIVDAQGGVIAVVFGDYYDGEQKARASFIVRACNEHDSMIQAWCDLKESMKAQRDDVDQYCCAPIIDEVIASCEAALAMKP